MYRIVKRLIDIVVSLIALLLLAPLLLVLMLLVRIDSPGPSIFSQTRVGREQKHFIIYKLRTMRTTAPRSVATGALEGAHITKLGAFLRKTSLDELPQLYNILRGDMSLVGPRPLVPEEENVHIERAQKGAYAVRPGITGWAQINGRDQVQPGTKANLDAYYAQNLSFRLDVQILFKTAYYVLTAQGIEEGATVVDAPPNDDPNEDADAKADHH